eukprot:Amastigsp_a339296_1180.p3 type:complete len:178 gc:universal Amastigsp_a339296_1180:503-1036(+)
MRASCSRRTASRWRRFSGRRSWRPVHDEVIDDVCCPAKSSAIISPAISRSVSARPSLYVALMNTSSTSLYLRPGLALRCAMIDAKSCTISSRAASRSRCCRIGAVGQNTVSGRSPASSLLKRKDTRSKRFSRISGPMRHRAAVRMISSESDSRRSITPSEPHLAAKNCSASARMSGT